MKSLCVHVWGLSDFRAAAWCHYVYMIGSRKAIFGEEGFSTEVVVLNWDGHLRSKERSFVVVVLVPSSSSPAVSVFFLLIILLPLSFTLYIYPIPR